MDRGWEEVRNAKKAKGNGLSRVSPTFMDLFFSPPQRRYSRQIAQVDPGSLPGCNTPRPIRGLIQRPGRKIPVQVPSKSIQNILLPTIYPTNSILHVPCTIPLVLQQSPLFYTITSPHFHVTSNTMSPSKNTTTCPSSKDDNDLDDQLYARA